MTKRIHRRFNKLALFDYLGHKPHPGQLEVHLSEAQRRVVACGVRWGKTRCAAMEGLAAALEPRERSIGWVVAPTYDLAERTFNEIVYFLMAKMPHRLISLRQQDHALVIRNMSGGVSEIRCKSADNPVSLLGEGLDWVVIDEASRLKPGIWQSHIAQRLIDKRGWALLISTPRGKGWFFDLWRRGRGPDRDPEYESWNQPSTSNPVLDPELIERQREVLPERVFRQEFGAEFLEGSGAVFRGVRELATRVWEAPRPNAVYYAGLDLAKVEDYSVLVIMTRSAEVVFVDRFHRLDWNLQINRVKGHLDRFNRARVLVDSTGAGEPVFEAMKRAGVRVQGYPFTSKSKADLVNNLSIMFEQRRLALPKVDLWPEGVDELEAFEYSVTEHGNVRTGAPSGVHDDCVMALALAAWQVKAPFVMPRYGVIPAGMAINARTIARVLRTQNQGASGYRVGRSRW